MISEGSVDGSAWHAYARRLSVTNDNVDSQPYIQLSVLMKPFGFNRRHAPNYLITKDWLLRSGQGYESWDAPGGFNVYPVPSNSCSNLLHATRDRCAKILQSKVLVPFGSELATSYCAPRTTNQLLPYVALSYRDKLFSATPR